jgi:hypothetical protein
MNFLKNIGFYDNTISVFRDSIVYHNDKIIFNFDKVFFNPKFKNEILFITRQRFIPASFFCIINPLNSALIVQAYFFNSVSEAMAFFQIKKNISFERAIFVITGNNPTFSNIQYLKHSYPSLDKYFLVYPNSLYGKIADVKLACFLSGNNNVSFILKNNILTVYYNSQSVSINSSSFSLSMIRKALSTTFPYKTFKSKIANSYFDEMIFNK